MPSAVGAPTTAFAGTALNLSGMTLTFNDQFTVSDVVADGGSGNWFTGDFGTFGLAPFQGAGSGTYPWVSGNQKLLIKNTGGNNWTGAMVQSVNSSGVGFSQALGYFAATMKLDTQNGTWPAFWLLSLNNIKAPSQPHCEIDVFEFYGEGLNSLLYLTGHVDTPPDQFTEVTVDTGINLGLAFHEYGVLITTMWVIIYFDRVEIARFPAWQASQLPMYMLMDHALHILPNTGDTATRTLQVSGVKVYQ